MKRIEYPDFMYECDNPYDIIGLCRSLGIIIRQIDFYDEDYCTYWDEYVIKTINNNDVTVYINYANINENKIVDIRNNKNDVTMPYYLSKDLLYDLVYENDISKYMIDLNSYDNLLCIECYTVDYLKDHYDRIAGSIPCSFNRYLQSLNTKFARYKIKNRFGTYFVIVEFNGHCYIEK